MLELNFKTESLFRSPKMSRDFLLNIDFNAWWDFQTVNMMEIQLDKPSNEPKVMPGQQGREYGVCFRIGHRGGEFGDLPLEASLFYHFECDECPRHAGGWRKKHRELNPEQDLNNCDEDPANGSAPD